jgi:sulfite exporter TauE/SafE/copper chaperone CopZ/plastocyanin domain-containing protein
MKTATIRIGGMTCINCQNRIEKALKGAVGVESADVTFSDGTAAVTYNASVIAMREITELIEKLGYQVVEGERKTEFAHIAGIAVIIVALYALLRGLGINVLTSAFPLAEAGMGYGMLFVIGLITSVHCAAMCGGINLSQCIPPMAARGAVGKQWEALLPSILYNGGRVLSYTTVGSIAGAFGSVITISGRFQGAAQLAAGVFMVIMGINMLGIFPALRRFNLHMPRIFAKKIDEQKAAHKNPLLIGILNGLMPCGPLQAMQLYALSTGSPIAGGISMLLFSLGTVPLMFGIGALSSILSKKFTRRVMKLGAILVTALGMAMFANGWNLTGVNFNPLNSIFAALHSFAAPKRAAAEAGTYAPAIEDGYQIVNSTLSAGRYPAITVQQGIPVKWTINASQGSINGCNNRMIIREYKIEHRFTPGENVIEFTPDRAGKFSYSCWMGMIRSSITVLEEGQAGAGDPILDPVPAGVVIPTDTIAPAEIQGAEKYGVPYQAIAVSLYDDGIDPAVILLQRGIPAEWTINNNSLDPGNSRLIFPAYYTQLAIEQGENVIQLLPDGDFDFSTGDNVFYGYVKVVEDLSTADIEAIQREVSDFETLIYPDAYFESEAGGACCGGAGTAKTRGAE